MDQAKQQGGVSDNTNNVTQVSAPVGSVQKEHGPLGGQDLSLSREDLLRPSEPEPSLHPEVVKAGVEASGRETLPKLTADDKNAGLTEAKESTPVHTSPLGNVQLPMTEGEAKQALAKERNTSNSLVWLAISVLRQIKMLHKKLTSIS